MIEYLIALIINVYQYGSVQSNEPISTGEVVVVDRQIPIPAESWKMGTASWYGKEVCGSRIYRESCKTASGEIFSDEELTFAHKSMPFDTRIRFCSGVRCVVCRLNDRGPYIDGRDFDLSAGCFNSIAPASKGIINITFKVLDNK